LPSQQKTLEALKAADSRESVEIVVG